MTPEFITWLLGQVGLGGIAGFSIWLLNEARKDMQLLISAHAAMQRDDKLILAKTLDENAKQAATLAVKVDTLLGLASKREEYLHDERVRNAKGS